MNFLSRTNLSSRLRILILRSATVLQQSNVYSTIITQIVDNSKYSTDGRTQESSESSSSFSHTISEQVDRPKPREIPYQGKIANSVSLIGYVKSPIRFKTGPNGNHFATTVISQEWREDSLLIPVVFEGDLAHVVAYHVKENNRVLISGRLSRDPRQFLSSDSFVNFHIVADNLNFVEEFGRNLPKKYGKSSSDGMKDKYIKMVDDLNLVPELEKDGVNDDDLNMQK